MPSISGISHNQIYQKPVSTDNTAAKISTHKLESDIQQASAKAASGTNPIIQYRYATGPDGTLIPVEATVISQTENKQAAPTESPSHITHNSPSLLALTPFDEIDSFGLTPDERRVVRELQSRDLEVRNHEAQHFHAASGLASGGPEFSFQVGPDGNIYAIGGHVDLHSGRAITEEQAARNAQTFALAASAPTDASAQDNAAARSALHKATSTEPDKDQNTATKLNITV